MSQDASTFEPRRVLSDDVLEVDDITRERLDELWEGANPTLVEAEALAQYWRDVGTTERCATCATSLASNSLPVPWCEQSRR